MSVTFPFWDGHATGTGIELAPYTAGEKFSAYVGRTKRPQGRTPMLYFHGFFGDVYAVLADDYQPVFRSFADAVGVPVIVPDLGGGSQWATPDIVGAGGHADDALDHAAAAAHLQTQPYKAAVHGVSMGSLNALVWAFNRPSRIRSVTLVGPIVWAEKFYDDAPGFQGAIDADWGGHPNFVAALDDIDPWRNIDLIRPFGHRIKMWYAADDEFIDPADVRAFAELVGAEAVEIEGTHADLLNAPADAVAAWAAGTIRDRRRVYVPWDDTDWDRFDYVGATKQGYPTTPNEYSFTTEATGAGRMGVYTRTAGPWGNDRHALLLREFRSPDSAVRTIWAEEGGGRMSGQQGNIHRAVIDEDAGTYTWFIAWHNVLFAVPWIVNRAIWTGDLAFPTAPDAGSLTQIGANNSTIAGLRLSAGGEILASERQGGIVTIVVRAADADANYRTGVMDVVFDGVDIAGYSGIVTRLDATHLQFPQAGGDVTSGGVGSWADFGACFPYIADTELSGDVMRGRFYKPGGPVPEWGDPDWGFTWDASGESGPDAYGLPGFMLGHVGIFDGTATGVRCLTGPLAVDEL